MEYIYAALLLHKLGKDIDEESIKKIVAAAGGDVDEAKVKSLVVSLKDVDIAKELENASLPASAPVPAEKETEEKKKEEKPKEEKKAAAAEGLSALFG
ncbi:MAG: 50S ribosomal protein P1 [Candidatus Aenigmatarchaeota archaeon]|nr:MAG: 50S ribosomal protein P1 [Candidatus Aenigmarchaeota archaeon]